MAPKTQFNGTQVPFAHTLFVGQTYPQAPQLLKSEYKSVQIPLQQVVPAEQQT
jgi:hypothetical protein